MAIRNSAGFQAIQPPEIRHLEHLHLCGQFVLAPTFVDGLEGWQRQVIGDNLRLTFYPKLSAVQAKDSDKSLTLLGFMLDPNDPDANDEDIINRLLERFASIQDLVKATSSYGGRWILIATLGRDRYLFSDAFGLRQAFYTLPEQAGAVYAMSQPGIGAQLLELEMDMSARAYMESHEFRGAPEYKWPAASSPFREIRRLLPNRYLDLSDGTTHRFWPNRRLSRLSLEESVEKVSRLLKGLMKAAANRFDLALAVTAGIDSRVVLAASREIRDKVTYFTLRQWHMPEENPDITVPAALLDRLGLEHEIVRSPVSTTPEFSAIFKSNVFLAHGHYAPDAEAILNHFSRTKVAVTGSGGEVGRCPFRQNLPIFDNKLITPAYLSRIEIGADSEFAVKYFFEWLKDLGDTHHVNKLDLFEWEQGCGVWVAMTQLEFNIAWKEIFTPFNCRDLLVAMLATNPSYRKGPDYPLFQCLIQKLWPEVLDAPINPHRQKTALGLNIQRMENLIRYFLQRIRYR